MLSFAFFSQIRPEGVVTRYFPIFLVNVLRKRFLLCVHGKYSRAVTLVIYGLRENC